MSFLRRKKVLMINSSTLKSLDPIKKIQLTVIRLNSKSAGFFNNFLSFLRFLATDIPHKEWENNRDCNDIDEASR